MPGTPCVSKSPLLIGTPIMLVWDFTVAGSFELNLLFKDLISSYSHTVRDWEVRISTYEFGGGGTHNPAYNI